MADKPTDKPEWASDHPIQDSNYSLGPGNADVVEPDAAKKGDGWDHSEAPPYEWFNWLFRIIYEWVLWFDDFDQNHTHDGGTSNYSAPKVAYNNLVSGNQHLNFGAEGQKEITQDDTASHEIVHSATGESRDIADVVQGRNHLRFADGDEETNLLINQSPGSTARAWEAMLRLEGGSVQDIALSTAAFVPKRTNSPSDGWGTVAPENEALYQDNLVKMVAVAHFTAASSSENPPNYSTIQGYNNQPISTHPDKSIGYIIPSVTTSSGFLLSVSDAIFEIATSTGAHEWRVESWYDAENEWIEFRPKWWDSSNSVWESPRQSGTPDTSTEFSVQFKVC